MANPSLLSRQTKKIKDAAFRARSNCGLIFSLHPPPPPQAFFPFSLPLFPVSYTISPFIFSPFRQIKRALSEKKLVFFSSALYLVFAAAAAEKNCLFQTVFQENKCSFRVCYKTRSQYIRSWFTSPRRNGHFILGAAVLKSKGKPSSFLARKKPPPLFILPKGELANTLYKAPLFPTPYQLPPPPPPLP